MTGKRTISVSLGLLGLLATGSLVVAQQLPLGVSRQSANGAAATASIQGYVVRVGGDPLSKAQVMLRPVEGRRTLFGAVTDTSGMFNLANIEPGTYRLHVERDGYVDQEYGQVSSSRPGTVLVLAGGQQVRDVVISMVPTGTIAGRVYDEDGDPIVGASIRAMRYDYNDGEKVLNPVQQAQTNDLGEYRLYWLTPGEYQVAATFEVRFRAASALRDAVRAADPNLAGLVRERAGETQLGGRSGALLQELLNQANDPLDEIYVDTYYPGTNDPLAASPIQVAAASEVRAVDFTVLPTRAVTIRGHVVGPYSPDDGFVSMVNIVPQSSVVSVGRNRGRGGRGLRSGRSRDGDFELTGIAPGSYTLVATVRAGGLGRGGRGGQPQMAGFADIQVGGEDINDLTVSVKQGVSVVGRILMDQAATAINVSRMRVRLEPMRTLPLGASNTRVEEDGTFLLENVSQTEFRVSLIGLPEDAYVAEVRSGGVDVLNAGLSVNPDVSPLAFLISNNGSRIDGMVQVGSNIAFTGAQVVLIPADPTRGDLYEIASADQYGRFSMRGIAPGRYRLFAWEDAPAGAYEDPEFVREYDAYGAPVEIRQGELVSIQPRLIPAGQ